VSLDRQGDADISPDLMKFIDQLIVPLLVDALLIKTRHLYSAPPRTTMARDRVRKPLRRRHSDVTREFG
jgi:hypothetical protein